MLIIRRLFLFDYVDNQEIIRLENEKMELTKRERELAEQLEEDRWVFDFCHCHCFYRLLSSID